MASHIQPENAKNLLAFRRSSALARRGRASAARSEPPEDESGSVEDHELLILQRFGPRLLKSLTKETGK